MHRLFVALRPPATVRRTLMETMQGVPDARWQDDDQLHLTARFLGDLDRHQAGDVVAALGSVNGSAITARIAGVGQFHNALWAGLEPRARLADLHMRIEGALRQAGVEPDRRAYLPHVTLARLPRARGIVPARERWLADHAGLASPDFTMDRLILFESTLGSQGARYEALTFWPLTP